MSLTQTLSDYLSDLKYQDLLEEVNGQAKLATLYTTGISS
jgi:hypothetical protein